LWRECPNVCTLMPHFSGGRRCNFAGCDIQFFSEFRAQIAPRQVGCNVYRAPAGRVSLHAVETTVDESAGFVECGIAFWLLQENFDKLRFAVAGRAFDRSMLASLWARGDKLLASISKT
jgi:hypothetical protein